MVQGKEGRKERRKDKVEGGVVRYLSRRMNQVEVKVHFNSPGIAGSDPWIEA